MQAETSEGLSRNVLEAANIGAIVLNHQQTIVLWNQWMERHATIPASTAVNQRLTALYPELGTGRVQHAIQSALESGLPSLLSQTLNKHPFPLYTNSQDKLDGKRLHQAIQVIPVIAPNLPTHCLIQISDVSSAVKRENILRQQAAELRAIMLSDGLTGIPNRRRFDEHAESCYRQTVRDKKPFSLIMIDIDFFKQYNDHYGHLKGDQTLIDVAQRLSTLVKRPLDLFARFGGEEFIAALPYTDQEGAVKIAQDMRASIEQLCIENAPSPLGGMVSISIGVATHYPTRKKGRLTDLIDLADKALYEAKNTGRNKVACKNDGLSQPHLRHN